LVSPLNCLEFAVLPLPLFRSYPQGSSLISRLQQNQSGPNERLARVVEATFLAPRPNATFASRRVRRLSSAVSRRTMAKRLQL
jgi:hypothetical protein